MVRFLLRVALSRVKGIGDVMRILGAVDGKVRDGGPQRLVEDVLLVASMVRESVRGRYRMSRKTLFTLAAALLYFIVPTDAIMDFLPMVGYIDDVAVLTYVLKTFAEEVERFKAAYGSSLRR